MIHNLRTLRARIACACWGFAARVGPDNWRWATASEQARNRRKPTRRAA